MMPWQACYAPQLTFSAITHKGQLVMTLNWFFEIKLPPQVSSLISVKTTVTDDVMAISVGQSYQIQQFSESELFLVVLTVEYIRTADEPKNQFETRIFTPVYIWWKEVKKIGNEHRRVYVVTSPCLAPSGWRVDSRILKSQISARRACYSQEYAGCTHLFFWLCLFVVRCFPDFFSNCSYLMASSVGVFSNFLTHCCNQQTRKNKTASGKIFPAVSHSIARVIVPPGHPHLLVWFLVTFEEKNCGNRYRKKSRVYLIHFCSYHRPWRLMGEVLRFSRLVQCKEHEIGKWRNK